MVKFARNPEAKPFVYVLERTAMKEHVCEFCSSTIKEGEKYFYKKGMTPKHEFYSKKYCDHCFSRENI